MLGMPHQRNLAIFVGSFAERFRSVAVEFGHAFAFLGRDLVSFVPFQWFWFCSICLFSCVVYFSLRRIPILDNSVFKNMYWVPS